MEPIKPLEIENGMTIIDEINESVIVVRHVSQTTIADSIYSIRVEGWSLDGYGERIEKNIMYHTEDGELYPLRKGPE